MDINHQCQYVSMLANTPAAYFTSCNKNRNDGATECIHEQHRQQSLLCALCPPTVFDSPVSVMRFAQTGGKLRREEEKRASPTCEEEDEEELSHYYDQATWRMYERIQRSRHDMYRSRCYNHRSNCHYAHNNGAPVMMISSKEDSDFRLRPRKGNIDKNYLFGDSREDCEEEGVFEMDL